MGNKFDSRYTDVQDTPSDIIIGDGPLAVRLSDIRQGILDNVPAIDVSNLATKTEVSTLETTVNTKASQTEVNTLKSDTDNKILSVRDAIVSKGGSVTGSPPTATQLVAGVNSLTTDYLFGQGKSSTGSIYTTTNNNPSTILTVNGKGWLTSIGNNDPVSLSAYLEIWIDGLKFAPTNADSFYLDYANRSVINPFTRFETSLVIKSTRTEIDIYYLLEG